MEKTRLVGVEAINDLSRHVDSLSSELSECISRVLASGRFVLGPQLEAFEAEFAAYCGSPHCVGVANGTDALELALRACGVRRGSRVLTVANAGSYSTNAILAVGAEPDFIDIDDETLLVDEQKLGERLAAAPVDAVIVTHLYGRMVPRIEEIAATASRLGVPLIEDCAQAHGAKLGGKMAGTFGDLGCFSFYPTKNLGALGDGGAVIATSVALRDRLRMLRQYGWSAKYKIELAGGRNSRLDEVQAAVLRAKLPRLDGWNERRRHIARQLSAGINHPRVRSPQYFGEDYVAHLYVVRSADRNALQVHLRRHGVTSDVHYPLLDYQQPAFDGDGREYSNPVAALACEEVLTLPCFPEMTADEVAAVINAVNGW